MEPYINGYVTSGDYFVYKGIRYGRYTKILFKDEFYERFNETIKPNWANVRLWGWKYPYFRTFHSIGCENGKTVWRLNRPNWEILKPDDYVDVDPERDIEKIVVPVWYMEPKELVKLRLENGTWINYIWPQTLVYALCLLVSPIFQQWYLIWTVGLWLYLRLCYIELSRGELNRGW